MFANQANRPLKTIEVTDQLQRTEDHDDGSDGSSTEAPAESKIIELELEDTDSEIDRIEIKRLHDSICIKARCSLDEGIRLGEILTKRKAKCGHGNYEHWLLANVEFTPQTARNYMRLFENRDWLKTKNVFDLTDAYTQIAAKDAASKKKPQTRKKKKKQEQYYRLQTVDGAAVCSDENLENLYLDFDPDGTHEDDTTIMMSRPLEELQQAEAELGIKCVWVPVQYVPYEGWLALSEDSPGPADSAPRGRAKLPSSSIMGAQLQTHQEAPAPEPKTSTIGNGDKKFDLSEFGDLNDIGTFNSMKVKLELTPVEFKIFNRGLNEATPTNEMEICAVNFSNPTGEGTPLSNKYNL